MTYYFRLPAPIAQKNPVTGEEHDKPLSLAQFLRLFLFNDPRFVAGFNAIRSGNNILDAIEGKNTGDWIGLADADYDLLKLVANEPKGLRPDKEPGYPNGLFMQFFAFLSAIMTATTEAPKETPVGNA